MRIFQQSSLADDRQSDTSDSSKTAKGWDYPQELMALEAARPLQCCLTAKDYGLLEHHMLDQAEHQGELSLLVRLMRAKLTDAQVMLADDLPPDVATSNSRISYAIDGGPVEERVLCHWDHEALAHLGLPITTLLGATLFGLRVGQATPLIDTAGRVREVELRRVLFQPERARQAIQRNTTEGCEGW